MELRNKVELVKRLDEMECFMSCTTNSSLQFLSLCLDDFKAYIAQRIKEAEEKAAESKENEV